MVQLMLCRCASCFGHVNLLTLTLFRLLPFHKTIVFLIYCCNSFTHRWHQLLAGFQFEAAGPTLQFELAEIAHVIFARLLGLLKIVYEAHHL